MNIPEACSNDFYSDVFDRNTPDLPTSKPRLRSRSYGNKAISDSLKNFEKREIEEGLYGKNFFLKKFKNLKKWYSFSKREDNLLNAVKIHISSADENDVENPKSKIEKSLSLNPLNYEREMSNSTMNVNNSSIKNSRSYCEVSKAENFADEKFPLNKKKSLSTNLDDHDNEKVKKNGTRRDKSITLICFE